MPSNPNVKQVIDLSKSAAEANASLNREVDDAFDQGFGSYQASQENTLAQIDALLEKTANRVKEATEKRLRKADQDAYQTIMEAYEKDGLKGEEDASNQQ